MDAGHTPFPPTGRAAFLVFDEKGNFRHLGVGKVSSLYREMKDAVLKDGVRLADALKTVTSNPAFLLKLKGKGRITEYADADLVLSASDTLEIDTVIAGGETVVSGGEVLKRGTFEY